MQVLPPPNVTGALHIGHALTVAIQDTIIRWRIMSGYNALWIRGMDHAGIATQVVVEKKIMRERNLTRHDIGRENFVSEVWNWKNEYGGIILKQLRRLGASLDWSREVEYIDIKEKIHLEVPGYEEPVEFGVLTSFAYPLEDDGNINSNGGAVFEGMLRFKARVAVTEALKKKENEMRLGICSRSKDVVEPLVKPQWFVNCQSMAKQALDAVMDEDNRKIEIIPKQYAAEWKREARDLACKKFSGREIVDLSRDPDVLDTWFSSGLFPLSALGWPDDTADLKTFYPTSVLETGHDILFFWVARMVMLAITLGADVPFLKVYLHRMIHDALGRKMFKSLGNVIDPLEVINGIKLDNLHERLKNGNLYAKEFESAKERQAEDFPEGIPECGADALRFALVSYTAQYDKINLDIKRVVGYRQWCNKLWNVKKVSIVISDYPSTTESWNNDKIEARMERVSSIVKKLRSKRATLLPNRDLQDGEHMQPNPHKIVKAPPGSFLESNRVDKEHVNIRRLTVVDLPVLRQKASVRCSKNDTAEFIKSRKMEICTLAALSSLEVSSDGDTTPTEDVVDESIEVFLEGEGTTSDPTTEVQRLIRKREEMKK
ncbi:hypothetical protein HAX54_020231 [Datura stramonium]|uniref:valine--tRNA ligase n=1 Tax=Datura stramonium TaxID=4076 RepID=A0ABS8UT49_DATST|nr:hypothetical protein [Datura stramonium]